MRDWLRRSRGYLIVLPVALALAFGYDGFKVWKNADLKTDVEQGATAPVGAATVKLTGLQVREPAQDGGFSASEVPEGAKVVVAKFRGRMDDAAKAKKLKFIGCEAKLEDEDGWIWPSESLSKPYIPDGASSSCTGEYMNEDFEDVQPSEGEWYTFYVGYYVPAERAQKGELYPTLEFYKDPRPVRFVPSS